MKDTLENKPDTSTEIYYMPFDFSNVLPVLPPNFYPVEVIIIY